MQYAIENYGLAAHQTYDLQGCYSGDSYKYAHAVILEKLRNHTRTR